MSASGGGTAVGESRAANRALGLLACVLGLVFFLQVFWMDIKT